MKEYQKEGEEAENIRTYIRLSLAQKKKTHTNVGKHTNTHHKQMKLLALVSGGKDSILAMMEAVKLGHTIACLANMYPVSNASDLIEKEGVHQQEQEQEEEIDEIDSHCFQTVGHANIEALAQCMEVPLRRRAIREGQSINTALEYHGGAKEEEEEEESKKTGCTAVDEVEELYTLVKDIITEFPDIKGVCSGAILSTYQRLRVENVCERLGLQSFGYLWSMEGSAVLDLVAAQHVDAILIKVATVGLAPRKHLGKSLLSDDLREHLLALEADYQVHPAGEGGEFESFVLDCPLFPSKCLAVSSRKIVIVDDNPICSSGRMEFTTEIVEKSEESLEARQEFLHNFNISCDAKTETEAEVEQTKSRMIKAYALNKSFHACGRYKPSRLIKSIVVEKEGKRGGVSVGDASSAFEPTIVSVDSLDSEAFAVDELASAADVVEELSSAMVSIEPLEFVLSDSSTSNVPNEEGVAPARGLVDQLSLLMQTARAVAEGLEREVRMLIVYAPDLECFASLNAAYARIASSWPFFPARAFVGIGVSEGRESVGSVFLRVKLSHRTTDISFDTLRIQSISHWGAATIGPYGQAVAERVLNTSTGAKGLSSLVVSGQIGLVPSTLTLADGSTMFEELSTGACCSLTKVLEGERELPSSASSSSEEGIPQQFVAEFAFMLANALCSLKALGPRQSGDLWAANSDYSWSILTSNAARKVIKSGTSEEGQCTRLSFYVTCRKHAHWAHNLWRAAIEACGGGSVSCQTPNSSDLGFFVVKSLPRGALVELVTECTFDTSEIKLGCDEEESS